MGGGGYGDGMVPLAALYQHPRQTMYKGNKNDIIYCFVG